MCINKSQRGISLIELILFIVIISIALSALLSVLTINTKASVDPLIRKQALAIAESLLEEVELQDFSNSPCGVGCAGDVLQRNSFDDVFDYNGINNITADVITGIAALSAYKVKIDALNPASDWGTIPKDKVAEITVTVTDPSNQTLSAVGYRVNYE